MKVNSVVVGMNIQGASIPVNGMTKLANPDQTPWFDCFVYVHVIQSTGRGIEDNSKIIFLIFQQKHVVTPH